MPRRWERGRGLRRRLVAVAIGVVGGVGDYPSGIVEVFNLVPAGVAAGAANPLVCSIAVIGEDVTAILIKLASNGVIGELISAVGAGIGRAPLPASGSLWVTLRVSLPERDSARHTGDNQSGSDEFTGTVNETIHLREQGFLTQ